MHSLVEKHPPGSQHIKDHSPEEKWLSLPWQSPAVYSSSARVLCFCGRKTGLGQGQGGLLYPSLVHARMLKLVGKWNLLFNLELEQVYDPSDAFPHCTIWPRLTLHVSSTPPSSWSPALDFQLQRLQLWSLNCFSFDLLNYKKKLQRIQSWPGYFVRVFLSVVSLVFVFLL